MTNNEIILLYEGILELRKKQLEVDATTCFLLATNKKRLEPIADSITEASQQLFKKYAERVGSEFKILPEHTNEFWEEYHKLMAIEIDIQLEKIPIEKFNNIKIELETMEHLLPIIEYKK